LIKLLLSGKQLLLFIIIAWSLLAFVSFNVLTVEAAEKDDKKVCESYGGEWKETKIVDGSGRSSGDRGCEIENEQAQQLYGIRAGESVDGTGADSEYGRIDLDMSDVEAAAIEDDVCSKNKDLDIKVCKEREEAAEIAAKEDAICDDEDADTTDIEICMSQVRKHQVENNLDKEECKEVNGEWKNGGYTFYEDEQNHEQQVIEDYGNTVSDIDDEFQKQQEYFETRAESSNNSNPEKIAEQILAEEENEQKEITPEEADEINEQNEEVSEQEETADEINEQNEEVSEQVEEEQEEEEEEEDEPEE
jgi:hypothetical protein